MKKPTILLGLLTVLIVVVLIIFFIPSEKDHFLNPYEQINRQTVNYYDANLHTHTTYSDGSYDPHQAIGMQWLKGTCISLCQLNAGSDRMFGFVMYKPAEAKLSCRWMGITTKSSGSHMMLNPMKAVRYIMERKLM